MPEPGPNPHAEAPRSGGIVLLDRGNRKADDRGPGDGYKKSRSEEPAICRTKTAER
jgi:hypothetical protein